LLPTFVELGGGKPPADIDGRSFARVLTGGARRHRDEIYASHTADNNGQMNCYPMRCVRNARFKYIRNLRTDLVYSTHIDRGVARDGRQYWDSWVARAKSDPKAAEVVRRYHRRPAEELYDIVADPHEATNLAGRPEHARTLADLGAKVTAWMRGMGDEGETWGTPRLLSSVELPV
jgi:arylsulfatase A-like enzyme